ncbi:hypothetical protein AVEN_14373-1, partial [Araneus ventricosus]
MEANEMDDDGASGDSTGHSSFSISVLLRSTKHAIL